MDTFDPRETVREGFLRVIQASGSKLKASLLKKRGIATHDIRLSIEVERPVALLDGRSPPADFYYLSFFERAIKNVRLRVLNASRTEPVVTEVHFFLEIPSKLGISAVSSRGPIEVVSLGEGTTVSIAHDMQREGLEPKVLKPGVVMAIPEATFLAGLKLAIDPEIRLRLGNEPDYCPPEEWLGKAIDAYGSLLNTCDVWYGLVLDNAELLPFKWQHEQHRFAPGFWTDGTVVS
jgi:hypothetical protein